MTKRAPASGKTGFLFSMLLFFVFLFCSVFTVLIGSRVYENIRERDNDSFYRDTAVSYVVNKIRQADQSGGVTVGETDDGTSFLLLTSQVNGAAFSGNFLLPEAAACPWRTDWKSAPVPTCPSP